MSMTTGVASSLPLPRPREAPQGAGAVAWVKANLFATWGSTAVTLALGYIIVRIVIAFVGWAFVWAVWSVPYSPTGIAETAVCQNAKGFGACWAVIHDKYRLILFGRYPYEEQWRPALVVLIFIGLYIVSAMRRFWRKELALIWIGALTVVGVLMWGGVFGLAPVTNDFWGGLPITLILATFGLAFGFPLAIFVALGRRSTQLPAVKLRRSPSLCSPRPISPRSFAADCKRCRKVRPKPLTRLASVTGRRPRSSFYRRRCVWLFHRWSTPSSAFSRTPASC